LSLRLEPSRLLLLWWSSLHLLLAGAATLVGWPAPAKWIAAAAVICHGVLRRPPKPPRLVIVTEDGFGAVPEWQLELRPLGPRSLACPYWVRLDLGAGAGRRDIVLLADQVSGADWRRLRALLARARGH
jgi:hypothetical protein